MYLRALLRLEKHSMAAKPKIADGSGEPRLPPEMWTEILSRLPVKSVLQSKSVCKEWYSLISGPNFIAQHITNLHEENGNRVLLQHFDTSDFTLSFSSHDESCMVSREHDNCDHILGEDLDIVGSCNGLICLSTNDWKPVINDVATMNFVIWNPVIRKEVYPPVLNYCSRTQHASFAGFGFDPKTSDFKVLYNFRNSASGSNDCKIFDLGKRAWRSISPPVPSLIVRRPQAECYANGAIHWSVSRKLAEGFGKVILSFNMSDESFREIKMPDCAGFTQNGNDDIIKTQCGTFGGLVHVIAWKIKRDDRVVDVSQSCSVWAMKEYGVAGSWTKVYNIDLQSARGSPTTQIRPHNFVLWDKGEVLMVHHLEKDYDDDLVFKQNLVLYNTGSKKSRHLFSLYKCFQDMCRYKESLALM